VNAEFGRGRRAEGSKLKVGGRGYRADDKMQKAEKSEGERMRVTWQWLPVEQE
jgi:hypothetical protein